MLCAVLTPSDGHASVLGMDVVRDAENAQATNRLHVAKVCAVRRADRPREPEFYAGVYGCARNGRCARCLDEIGLNGSRADAGGPNSPAAGGNDWRLGCALVHQPKLLFLDERRAALTPSLGVSFGIASTCWPSRARPSS